MSIYNLKRFGLMEGDEVRPTPEYETFFNESFRGTILFFEDTLAYIVKDNGERMMKR